MEAAAESFCDQTWSYFVPGKHPSEGWVRFTSDGRMIQWMKVHDLPQPDYGFIYFYEILNPQSMRIWHKSGAAGWSRTFAFRGHWFVMSSDIITWLLERVEPADVPEWFTQGVDLRLKG